MKKNIFVITGLLLFPQITQTMNKTSKKHIRAIRKKKLLLSRQ